MPASLQRPLLVLVLALVTCTALAAEEDAPDPGALAALVKMGEHLRGLQQYAIDAESDSDQLLENGQALVVHARTQLLVSAPDKLRVQVTSTDYQRSLFYDGQQFTLYDSRQGYFGREVAPTSQEELLALLGERYGIQLPLADLIHWGPDTAQRVGIGSALHVGTEQVGDQSCEHYAYRQPGLDWQLWLRQGAEPLPCKRVLTRLDQPERPRHSVTYQWDTLPMVGPTDFVFTPPEGAKPVPLLELQAEVGGGSKP
ncbi:DUF2092 domain-containing protein [Pseudomonas sp. TUM22785]|uniref:DUF2092 domain-containing protein n=1 Tax=Pseudomonas sp. TUM22785 TaxID=3019098 RepID=UPI002305859C|nr:DUF2092 domain-containing protein [Pseudomonas sp. TUM22785]WCD78183.1 DUF2092 domain-containing protein [Pseudomonas sp. TUM22785]